MSLLDTLIKHEFLLFFCFSLWIINEFLKLEAKQFLNSYKKNRTWINHRTVSFLRTKVCFLNNADGPKDQWRYNIPIFFFLQGWSRLAWRSNRYYGWWTVTLLWKFFVSQKPVSCIVFNYLLCNSKIFLCITLETKLVTSKHLIQVYLEILSRSVENMASQLLTKSITWS